MEKWFVPPHQLDLAGQTVNKFGYDNQGTIQYSFNSQGFRSSEPGTDSRIVVLGNSVTFGIGLMAHQTLGHLLSQELGVQVDNYSFGCYLHSNHDYLTNLKILTNQDIDSRFIIQINNLNRISCENGVTEITQNKQLAVKTFRDYFDQVIDLVAGRPCVFVYWDDQDYDIPKSIKDQILIYNKFHVDQSIDSYSYTFGPRSHQLIARSLACSLKI